MSEDPHRREPPQYPNTYPDGHEPPPAPQSPWGTPPPTSPSTTPQTWGEAPPNQSGYGYGAPQQPQAPAGYTAPSGYGTASVDPTSRNWAVGAHLSGFVAAWFALGFLGPLVVLLVAGNTSPFVRRHATEALNFNLSVLIYIVVSVVLVLLLIGVVLLPIIGIVYVIASIRGALAASRGEDYRYPITIRFVG